MEYEQLAGWLSQPWQWPAAAGSIALLVAIGAGWAERRRHKRTDPDAVGCMPWMLVYIGAFLIACVLLGLALRMWFAS